MTVPGNVLASNSLLLPQSTSVQVPNYSFEVGADFNKLNPGTKPNHHLNHLASPALNGSFLSIYGASSLPPWVGLEKDGDGNAPKTISGLERNLGARFICPLTITDVKTPFGTVHVQAGAAVLIINSATVTSVYNMGPKETIEIICGDNTVKLSPWFAVIFSSLPLDFEHINPAPCIGYRHLLHNRTETGISRYIAQFNGQNALQSLEPLKMQMDKNPQARKLYPHLLRSAREHDQIGRKLEQFTYYFDKPHAPLAHTRAKLSCEKYKLKNGLEVILSPEHSRPFVAVSVYYKAGPANEKPGKTGLAHLCEHMMFEGSKHVKEHDYEGMLEAAGAMDINATTEFDLTSFFETVPSDRLEMALWLESDRMGFLSDVLDHESLTNQRDVVRNELRERENQPYDLATTEMFHQLFAPGHPYYAGIIGSHRDLESASLSDVRAFCEQLYTPNNASLVITGDFELAKARSLVEKYFATLPSKACPAKPIVETPALTVEHRAAVHDKITLPAVIMAWITPPAFAEGSAEAEILATLLQNRRLFRRLVYGRHIASDDYAKYWPCRFGSVLMLRVTARPHVKPRDLELAINKQLAKLSSKPPTDQEIEEARNDLKTEIAEEFEHLGGLDGRANQINKFQFYLRQPGYLEKALSRYDSVTASGLRNFASKYLTNKSRVVVYALPGEKTIDDVARTTAGETKEAFASAHGLDTEIWRVSIPGASPSTEQPLPVPKTVTLKNGLDVRVLERHDIPVVSVCFTVKSTGNTCSSPKPGLEFLTARALTTGTTESSSDQQRRDLDRTGAKIETKAEQGCIKLCATTLAENLDLICHYIADTAQHPALNHRSTNAILKRQLIKLSQEVDSDSKIAERIKLAIGYGLQSPCGFPARGVYSATKLLAPEDAKNLWKNVFAPDTCSLAIAGDITTERALELAEKYFGGWSGHRMLPEVMHKKHPIARKLYLVDCQGLSQSNIMLVGPGPEYSALDYKCPDRYGAEIMNCVFGGMWSSRLNMMLREKNGYCYDAFSKFEYQPGGNLFVASTKVRTDSTGLALTDLLHQITGMKEKPITQEELASARQCRKTVEWRSFETSSDMAREMSNEFIYNYSSDDKKNSFALIDAVTQDDVQKMVEKYLNPNQMAVVIIGDKKAIEPDLEKLGYGKPILLRYENGDLKI